MEYEAQTLKVSTVGLGIHVTLQADFLNIM